MLCDRRFRPGRLCGDGRHQACLRVRRCAESPFYKPVFSSRYKPMSDVAERVKKIVVEHLGVDESKVTDNASFIDDLGADSLDTAELVMAFEEEFGCEIPDDAAETILTVGDATKFLEKNAKS